MNDFAKGALFSLLFIYIISPIDAVPGPIDDALLLLAAIASRKSKKVKKLARKSKFKEDY